MEPAVDMDKNPKLWRAKNFASDFTKLIANMDEKTREYCEDLVTQAIMTLDNWNHISDIMNPVLIFINWPYNNAEMTILAEPIVYKYFGDLRGYTKNPALFSYNCTTV